MTLAAISPIANGHGLKQTHFANIASLSCTPPSAVGDDRQALEQLCRYITRPALATEQLQTTAAGQVVLKPKTRWRDGIMGRGGQCWSSCEGCRAGVSS